MDLEQLRNAFAQNARIEAHAGMQALFVGAILGLICSTVLIWIYFHVTK